MRRLFFLLVWMAVGTGLRAQAFEAGVQTSMGPAFTTFKGDLAGMVGFSELEITEAQIDTAFAQFDLGAPRWLKELFPGLRIEVDQAIARQLTRNVKTVRFFARYKFIGGSFSISDPRLTDPAEARKLKNQLKAVRLSLAGKAEELAVHLAEVALADAQRVDPFFEKRYDLEAYVHLKKLFYGDRVLLEWGQKKNNILDFEGTAGLRFTADPSPIVDLGSVLFVSERIDELMEGGLLGPVENTTDQIAEAIQSVVFGKFKDPRVVPSMGWFGRGELLAGFGDSFSLVAGVEVSVHQHLAVKGTKPMFSAYGYGGLRWSIAGERKKGRR